MQILLTKLSQYISKQVCCVSSGAWEIQHSWVGAVCLQHIQHRKILCSTHTKTISTIYKPVEYNGMMVAGIWSRIQ